LRALIVAAFFAVALGASTVADVSAASETAIVVRVQAPNGTALPARVYVVGTSMAESFQRLTGSDGEARIVVTGGRYWVRVESGGYQSTRQEVEVGDGEIRHVTVTLAELSEIGRTHSKTDVVRTVSQPGSTARRISRDLAEALSSVAGISAAGNASGLGLRVSVNGDDESFSQFSFGGAPLPANAASFAINTDLVQTVQIDQSREMLQFAGLNPTGSPVSRARLRAGSYGSSLDSLSHQNTFGETGIAVLHSVRGEESPLNGAVYRDSSGTSYRHVGALHTTGDYAKITAPLGTFGGSAQISASTNLASPLATYYAGTVPAGSGAGEFRRITSRNKVIALNGAIGSNSVAVTYATFSVLDRDRQPQRIVDGLVFPFDLQVHSSVETFSGKIERGLTQNVTADASVQVFNQQSRVDLAGRAGDAAQRNAQTEIALHGSERNGSNWSLTYTGGRVTTLPYGSFEARATRPLAHNVSLSGVVSAGTVAQEPNDVRRARGWIEPYEADFDCGDNMIVTEGPGDSSATPHRLRLFGSLAANGGVVHTLVSAWYTHTSGQLLSGALTPITATDASLPPGYVAGLLHEAASPLRCNVTTPPTYSIFARRDIGQQSTTNRGASATLVADRGALHVELGLEYISTQLDALDPRLRDPQSVYFAGRQLRGIAPFRATLLLDRAFGAKAELLASLHYEAANNSYNLPPYFITAFGVSRRLSPSSSFSLVAGNVFNAYAGAFVSPRFAIPVETQSGALLRGVAAPLAPFRVSGQYDLQIGR
jgi:Carboxypeptidase regulatory-like domain